MRLYWPVSTETRAERKAREELRLASGARSAGWRHTIPVTQSLGSWRALTASHASSLAYQSGAPLY